MLTSEEGSRSPVQHVVHTMPAIIVTRMGQCSHDNGQLTAQLIVGKWLGVGPARPIWGGGGGGRRPAPTRLLQSCHHVAATARPQRAVAVTATSGRPATRYRDATFNHVTHTTQCHDVNWRGGDGEQMWGVFSRVLLNFIWLTCLLLSLPIPSPCLPTTLSHHLFGHKPDSSPALQSPPLDFTTIDATIANWRGFFVKDSCWPQPPTILFACFLPEPLNALFPISLLLNPVPSRVSTLTLQPWIGADWLSLSTLPL